MAFYSYDPSFRPRLRAVEILPFEHQGERRLLLRDPLGYAQGAFMLSAALAPVLALMDGAHTLRDLQVAASRLFGRLVMLEELGRLVASLDENLLLETPKFTEAKEKLEREFLEAPVRPPAHAGQAYPEDPEGLKRFLEEILTLSRQDPLPGPPRALIAPHIDLRCGARGFAAAYQAARFPKGARLIVFGTGHFLESIVSVLPKDFETPLGRVRVDQDFILALEKAVGPQIYGHLWGHRLEHSIEFQVLFQRYLLGEEYTLVPILCSGLEAVQEEERRWLEAFVTALKTLADEKTYFVAGVDFCHLGLRYGDLVPAGEAEKEKALAYDYGLLQKILALDPEGFYDAIMQNQNRYRICGFGPLYLLLKVLAGRRLKGKILHQEAVDFGEGSIVSFAAAVLFDAP